MAANQSFFGKFKKFFGFGGDEKSPEIRVEEVGESTKPFILPRTNIGKDAKSAVDFGVKEVGNPQQDDLQTRNKRLSAARNNVVLDKRWYEDDDMQMGLNKNNSGKQGVHVFGAVPAQTSDLLEQSIKTAKAYADKGENALIPCNVSGNHWVGGVMTKIGKEVCFVHNDPMGNQINSALKKELTAQGIAVIDLQCRQQRDGDAYNCGPFTVDNLTKISDASKKANSYNLTKEEFAANLKIGLESGVEMGQNLRVSQLQESQSRGLFVDRVTSSGRGAGSSGVGGVQHGGR